MLHHRNTIPCNMIGPVSFVVRACVILSVCVGPAMMGPAPTAAFNASLIAWVTSATPLNATTTTTTTPLAALPNPYAGLPTKFGDEDDVIRLKHTRPATAAVIQQQRPSSVAAARKSQFDAISSADASKEAAGGRNHGPDDDAYYDEDDDDGGDEDDEHGARSVDDFDVGHKSQAPGSSADYADETDGELGPTLDNFGASLDDGTGEAPPILLVEPQSAYIVRGRPAVLTCKAANALQLSFKCSGSSVPPPSALESHVNPHTGVHLLEVTATITKDMVYEFFGKEAFKCRCHAWSPRGKAKSQPATIEIAYIGKQFSLPPQAVRVEVGGRTEIRCGAPSGLPPPTLQWLKNGQPLSLADASASSASLTTDGNVLIAHATMNDMANYTCVAENLAGKKFSTPVVASVYVNGGWDAWGPWTECRCPGRSPVGQKRTRTCTNPSPANGGASCNGFGVQKTTDCVQCSGGRWSGWSEWGTCTSECIQVRRRSCIGVNFDSTSSPAGTKWMTAIIDNSGGGGNDGSSSEDSLVDGSPSHANHPADKAAAAAAAACNGRDIQTAECRGGDCHIGADGIKWTMYAGLAVLGVVCLALGALLARTARKGFRYGFSRTGPPPTYVCGTAEHKTMQFQPAGSLTAQPCNITSNYEYPSLHYHSLVPSNGSGSGGGGGGVGGGGGSVISQKTGRPMSEHHYDVPQMSNDNFRPLVGLGSNCSSNSYCPSNYSRRTASPSSIATTVNTYGNDYA